MVLAMLRESSAWSCEGGLEAVRGEPGVARPLTRYGGHEFTAHPLGDDSDAALLHVSPATRPAPQWAADVRERRQELTTDDFFRALPMKPPAARAWMARALVRER